MKYIVRSLSAWFCFLVLGCGDDHQTKAPKLDAGSPVAAHHAGPHRVDSRPAPMAEPVPLWENGKITGEIDAATASLKGYVVIDLGEAWTPYIFTERGNKTETPIPNAYRATYLQLARGEFPKNHHGERAEKDKYLELYGIAPTLHLLRSRFHKTKALECAQQYDLKPLETFEGFISYEGNTQAKRDVTTFMLAEHKLKEILHAAHLLHLEELDRSTLKDKDARWIRDYERLAPRVAAVKAAQVRLHCEGFFVGKGSYIHGGLDWATHEALAEFEKRNRVYGWGYIGKETLTALRTSPLETERQAALRVLTERAMHSAGVIEDGSTSKLADGKPRTFKGVDGKLHPIPNLEEQLKNDLTVAFGLTTPESTLAWLESLGDLPRDREKLAAFKGPELPEYYDGDMDLFVNIDRGDVWYEFPYDEQGRERPQPVSRRPRLVVMTKYLNQTIPLARFGTTIGGWRGEFVNGVVMWKYKDSPVGERAWNQVVASPVWLPPESTPPDDLLERNPKRKAKTKYRVNYHETGPSYASAYGLVAAYHMKYAQNSDGTFRFWGDEGIRTHGSVDYMSIMRRHSHGCHRMHNHIAVRLMSFVLAHRPHVRVGQQRLAFRRELDHEGEHHVLEIDEGGYVFALQRPVFVNVLEGNIRGKRQTPIETLIPKYDPGLGAYVLPDGGAVQVSPQGGMHAIPFPILDGGRPDGGALKQPRSDAGVAQQNSINAVAPIPSAPSAP